MKSSVPQFSIRVAPLFTGWWAALGVLASRQRREKAGGRVLASFRITESPSRLPSRALFSSALLHFSILFFLVRVPLAFSWDGRAHNKSSASQEKIFYELRVVSVSKPLPNLKSRGPGGRPGRGIRRERLPARGSTAPHPRLTIVLSPPKPDNTRQTIVQTSSPPELRIPYELRVPNVFAGGPAVAPKPRLEFRPIAAPAARAASSAQPALAAPAIPAVPSNPGLVPMPEASSQEHPALPISAGSAMVQVPKAGNASATATAGEEAALPGNGNGLLAISVDPAQFAQMLGLPPGNRYGSFSISPAGAQPGSPGGVPGGDPQGGTVGPGNGGDGSTAVGSGNHGGGGGNNLAGHAGLSIAGGSDAGGALALNGASAGGEHLLHANVEASVFPILAPPHIRRIAVVVFAGPMGGGGLDVYGVLKGGKIYTIFLPMPGKNWVLQYCLHNSGPRDPAPESRGAVVQLGQAIVPPDPVERFDFQRFPVPEDKADKFIVLRGVIRGDGTVEGLSIYQGVQPVMDQAALAALRKWKFKPALRDNKPVTVDILVGIPARVNKP